MLLDSQQLGKEESGWRMGHRLQAGWQGENTGEIVQGPHSLSPLAALQVRGSLTPSAFSQGSWSSVFHLLLSTLGHWEVSLEPVTGFLCLAFWCSPQFPLAVPLHIFSTINDSLPNQGCKDLVTEYIHTPTHALQSISSFGSFN